LPEPVEHVLVDADVDVAFSRRYALDCPRPIDGIVEVVGIGCDARFGPFFLHGFDRSPVRPGVASRQHRADFLSRVARDIALFLHSELSPS
jgi:hypothetical protein